MPQAAGQHVARATRCRKLRESARRCDSPRGMRVVACANLVLRPGLATCRGLTLRTPYWVLLICLSMCCKLSFDGSVEGSITIMQRDFSRIVVFPGLSGAIKEVEPLLHALRRQPVVVVSYPDWPEIQRDHLNKAALLARCRAQIGDLNDVAFFGYSFGGLVALALAAEELGAGRPAPLMGLLDTLSSSEYVKPAPAPFVVRVARSVSRGLAVEAVWNRLAKEMIRAHWPLKFLQGLPHHRGLGMTLQCNFTWPILEEFEEAMVGITEPLPMHAVLFRCKQQAAPVPDDLGWRNLIRHVRVVDIPGTHMAMTRMRYAPILEQYLQRSGWLDGTPDDDQRPALTVFESMQERRAVS